MNKKKFKVIQLNGFSGFILVLGGLLAIIGTVTIMPVYGVKFLWNEFISPIAGISTIRLAQAALLWFAILAVLYGYLRNRIQFKIINRAELPDNVLKQIDYDNLMDKIKKEQQNDEKINR